VFVVGARDLIRKKITERVLRMQFVCAALRRGGHGGEVKALRAVGLPSNLPGIVVVLTQG
jgi:hypothetical protein